MESLEMQNIIVDILNLKNGLKTFKSATEGIYDPKIY